MQRLSYVPLTINASQMQQQPQQQQTDQIYGISLVQANTYRNISIPRRRSTQYSLHDNRRQSLDISNYQYKNPIPPTQQYQQVHNQPQQHVQFYNGQRDQQINPYNQNSSYQYVTVQQQGVENINPQMYQNNLVQLVQYPNYQSNQNQQITGQPIQLPPNQNVSQHQYGSSLMKYNIIPASSNKYSESEKQQIAKIAAKYRELKQVNANILNKRHSVDNTSLQIDPQKQVSNGFYISNRLQTPSTNNYGGHQPTNTNSSFIGGQSPAISGQPQGTLNTLRQSISGSTRDSDIYQNYKDRYLNGSMNGSFINQYNDPSIKPNQSLNSSIQNDNYLSKPRSYSQATRGEIQQQNPYILNNQNVSPVYHKVQQNHPHQNQIENNKNQIDYSIDQAHQLNNAGQNVKILQQNINYQNQPRNSHTPISIAHQNNIHEKNNKIIQEQSQYLSETMRRNATNYKRQSNEGNPHLKAVLSAQQARRGITENPIHIQSVELLLSAEKKQNQNENEIVALETNVNHSNKKAQIKNNQHQYNSEQQNSLYQRDKENHSLKPQHTFTNNSSVVIEYNEVYKSDQIPISHAKMTQSKLVCDQHTSSIQNKLNQAVVKDQSKQPQVIKLIQNQSLEDVKKQVDQQVKQIQQESQARSKQRITQQEVKQGENKNISKGYYFVENNVISHTNGNKNDKTLSLNGTKINQNMDTSFNCSDLLQLSLSNIGTPITVQYQSNQPAEQKDAIQVFNNYQPSDRSSSTQRELQEDKDDHEIENISNIVKKQIEEVPKSSRNPSQLPTPPPQDPNVKTTFYHKKNICKIAEAFTFNTNLSSSQTQQSIEYNNSSIPQQEQTRKTCFTNNFIQKQPIEQIRKNQQQVLEVNETQASYLFNNESMNTSQLQGSGKPEKIRSIDDLEKSHQQMMNIHHQFQKQNSIQNISKVSSNTNAETGRKEDIPDIKPLDQSHFQPTVEINSNQQIISQNNGFDQQDHGTNNQKIQVITSQPQTQHINKSILEQKVITNSNKSLTIPQFNPFDAQDQQQQRKEIYSKDQFKQNQEQQNNQEKIQKCSIKIEERTIEEFADALYWQLNIERSLLQLKSGLSRKITELDFILPEYTSNIENTQNFQQGESLQLYRDRLNKTLGTAYTIQELEIIFHTSNQIISDESQIKKEDVLEVLIGTQNLTITNKAQEITEETKKIIRNIIKETLRALMNFKEVKSRFKEYQNELFLHISNGNKDLITYSDFKSFLIKNGYQVRDQEMMLLIYRFHKPNSIRLSLQQFQFVI